MPSKFNDTFATKSLVIVHVISPLVSFNRRTEKFAPGVRNQNSKLGPLVRTILPSRMRRYVDVAGIPIGTLWNVDKYAILRSLQENLIAIVVNEAHCISQCILES